MECSQWKTITDTFRRAWNRTASMQKTEIRKKLLKIKTFFNDRAAERDEKKAYIHFQIIFKIRKRILIYIFRNIIFKMLIQHLQNEKTNVFIYF